MITLKLTSIVLLLSTSEALNVTEFEEVKVDTTSWMASTLPGVR